jgi:hypothetical protein
MSTSTGSAADSGPLAAARADQRWRGRLQYAEAKKQKPSPMSVRVFRIKPLAVTYSCMEIHTTIGAAAFHFRVRDGIGWDHSAIAARERVEAAHGCARPQKG